MVIAKYRAKIAAIDAEVAKLRSGLDSAAPRVVSTPEPPPEHCEERHRAGAEVWGDTDMTDADGETQDAGHGGLWL